MVVRTVVLFKTADESAGGHIAEAMMDTLRQVERGGAFMWPFVL